MPATIQRQLASKLERFGQQHVLRFWDQLDASGRERLAGQLSTIDLAQLDRLVRGSHEAPDWKALARRAELPPAVRLSDRRDDRPVGEKPLVSVSAKKARQEGSTALAAGEIGVLLVAGGQGSRLGFARPKGMFPIGPVSGASLLQIHLEKALAAAKRHGRPVPVYLMTSPDTHDQQLEFLDAHDYFGLPKDEVFVFCQGTMPAVDAATGRLLLAEKDSLFLSPDGHGGALAAMAASGAFEHMHQRGICHLFYLQVDNPMVPICDGELIGYHLAARSEMTSVAVAKQSPGDKVGNFVFVDGHMQVIEYSDFPDDVAERRGKDGSLVFWAGSIAVHVFDVAFLERCLTLGDALPFHVARKKVSHLDDSSQRVEPRTPNALKFERFIFDLLPHAANPLVVEYAEEDVFAPLKNASGAERDTAEHVQRFMIAQHRLWLESAGARVAKGVAVEISPLWALDADDVTARVAPGMVIDAPTYLRDD